jgi:hypothetical protein
MEEEMKRQDESKSRLKLEAIAFADWTAEEGWISNEPGLWENAYSHKKVRSTSQLYDLFKKETSK